MEAADTVAVREPDLPNFTKVSSLSLHEIGLPIRMFTAGRIHPKRLNILSKCKIFLCERAA